MTELGGVFFKAENPEKLYEWYEKHLGYGFNELANEWHSDHIFKHDSGAIECFLLVAFLAYNIFHVFLARNVKPAVRQGKTEIFWARLIAAELYSEVVPADMSP